MTTFQIIMVALMSIGFAVTLVFSVAFVVEAIKTNKLFITKQSQDDNKEEKIEEEYDIRTMLAQLEEEAAKSEESTVVSDAQKPQEEEVREVVEQPQQEEVANQETIVEDAPQEEVATTQAVEEQKVVEQPTIVETEEPLDQDENPKEDDEEDQEESLDKEDAEDDDEEDDEVEISEDVAKKVETPRTIVIKEVTTETVGTDFDYNVRLAKIVESKNKLERDIQKTKRSIMKYERTERRRTRNQKMLDRRAVELTNLNLMMYSVTDIKNVDEDKKVKQDELTRHIAELKASIQDAEVYLEKNREKYEHDKKMYAFYTKEEARYNDEIKELEILIKNANSITGSTTKTTTTTVDGGNTGENN